MARSRKILLVMFFVGLIVGSGLTALIISSGPGPIYTITTAGSTTVYPLSQEWATRFHDENPNFIVNPSTGGSGLGQSQVASGLIDIGASSSYPKDSYWEVAPQVKILPVSADALGIVANPAINGSVLKLDCDMVVAIFQRNVTTWEEFAATFGVTIKQTGPINVYVRSDASGTTATFGKWLDTADENINANGAEYEWILGHEETISWRPGTNSVDGNPGVAEGVLSDDHGIGYVGLAFMEGLTAAELYNPGNGEWVTANLANVLKAIPDQMSDPGVNLMNSPNQGAYPIGRLLYYLVNTQKIRWDVIIYLNWVLIQGQKYIHHVGYVPINGTSAITYAQSVVASLTPVN
ncbi:MAG: PstS family phosphate ABC transporter substrate-binding protein [Candidatus Thorarchaeota archaeon]|nr:PstS family phosphate ABC transporter substrate-binding protein [Candidatus Thorarchaeota archaeon]